ncbi:general transcription factor IIF subunit 1-like isoform X2 [Lineus longissimus]|uniref:general transcription factor IIF subunit 1-like isoform X2 n=1 Tax=Lineus longissimus TaxID=88925 RepID=UPI00315D89DF
MATGSAAVGPSQEFVVRAPRNANKKVSIMKFSRTNKVDFAKCGPVKIERENNLRQYKASHDIETLPKFGAGSEFGREQKEEARRKKYGVMLKRYDPENQPWILKTGQGKETRRFKGTREGGISENTSYYIFTQCPDGAFEAVPVNDWYTFNPVINYRHLTMEEAEEEFERRDKTLNYFSIMVKKRLNKDEVGDDEVDDGEGGGKKKSASKKKGFMMMDKDDWTDDEEDDDDDDDEDGDKDDEDRQKKKDNKSKKQKRPVKNSKKNDDDEAIEESDEGDYDDKEVDYITDSESTDDSDLDIMGDKYREQGVVDEDGLRRLNESGESEEEEEEKKPEEEEAPVEEKKEKPKDGSDSDSSSDSSDSDDSDDLEQGGKFLFLGGGKPKKEAKKDKKEKKDKSGANSNSNNTSRSSTPMGQAQEEENAKKRKLEPDAPQNAKKSKVDLSLHPSASAPFLSGMQSSIGITEDNIRRYLTRKPMTTKDLLQKFKSKQPGESKEHLVTTVAQLLKKINPEKTVIKGKMYLYLKKPE